MTMLTIEKTNNFKKKQTITKKKQTEMKRKHYTAPTTTVVVMQHRTQLLMASGTEANRSSYGTANYGVDSKELDSDGNWEWE